MYRVVRCGVLSIFVCGASGLHAAELGFMGSLGLQYKQLTMDQEFTGLNPAVFTASGSGDLTAVLPALAVQGVTYYDAFYAGLKIESGLTNDGADSDIPFTTAGTDLTTDVSRNDASVILGYRVQPELSLFTGYMSGKTELEPEASTCETTPAGRTCNNTAGFMKDSVGATYKQEYTEDGIFFGVSYSMQLGPGRVSSSVAYAFMDGEYSDNYRVRDRDGNIVEDKFKYEGDSEGLSLALTWTAPINQRLGYFVDGRFQRYSMDASDKSNNVNYIGTKVKTDESLLGLTGGIQVFF